MEQNTLYSYKLKKGACTLRRIRQIQTAEISGLTTEEQNNLYEALERGVDIISSEIQMCMYMYSYGKMHIAKLNDAFNHVDKKIFEYDDIAIIDYGCGQGIATLALIEYLKANNINVDNIKSVTLIEPSKICLERAELHISLALPNCTIKCINKKTNDIYIDELSTEHYYTIHLFSNILDVDNVDVRYLSKLILRNRFLFAEYICVGPCFADFNKQKRYDLFGEYIHLKPHYVNDFEKGQWLNNWTYSVRLYSHNILRGLTINNNNHIELLSTIYNAYSSHALLQNIAWCWYDDEVLKGTEYVEHLSDTIRLKVSTLSDLNNTQKQCGESFDIYNIKYYLKEKNHKQVIVDEIIDCYKKAANDGVYEAYNNLGVYILQTNEDSYNDENIREEALRYFREAAEHGSERAVYNVLYLGIHFQSEDNVKWLLKYYREKNCISALFVSAIAAQFGKLGFQKDVELAEKWYEQILYLHKANPSLDEDDIEIIASRYNLAQIHYTSARYSHAYELLKECIPYTKDSAVLNFMYILEAILFDRPLVEKLKKLLPAEKHECEIYCNIALCYEYGIGVPQDLSLSEEYMQRGIRRIGGEHVYEYPAAIEKMAMLKHHQGLNDEAIALWDEAKQLNTERECAITLNQEVVRSNDGHVSISVVNNYLHNGCKSCDEATNYNEQTRICPRCEMFIAEHLWEHGQKKEALEYMCKSSYQGYAPAQRKFCNNKELRELAEKNYAIDDCKLLSWALHSMGKDSVSCQIRASILYRRMSNYKKCLYWAAIAANSGKESAILYILRLYLYGFAGRNTRDMLFWAAVLGKKRNVSHNKVLGDILMENGKIEAAKRVYEFDKK